MKPISKKLAKRRGRRSKEELVDNSSTFKLSAIAKSFSNDGCVLAR